MNKEAFYDEHIAPVLLELARKCKENGLSMAVCVQYGPENGERGTTIVTHPDTSLPMVMANQCIMTAPDVDAYMIGLASYYAENGINMSGSVYMSYPMRGSA